ncbi:MAG: nuclear transport factor 2 family protein [Demequina sp.]
MSTEADHLDRLDRLESIDALRRIVAQYAHAADKHDVDGFLSTFHSDAAWDVGSTRFVGHDQIRSAIEYQWGVQPEMHHWTTNVLINMTGPDRASASSDVAVLTRQSNASFSLSAGTYYDVFERRSGVWALAERRAAVHSTIRLSDGAAGEVLARSADT